MDLEPKIGSHCCFHASEPLEIVPAVIVPARITLSLISFFLLFHLYLCPLTIQLRP
jgi:hypothetical protein